MLLNGDQKTISRSFAAILLLSMQAVELPLKISQTAAVMEVVHAVLRIVKSPVAITGESRTRLGT